MLDALNSIVDFLSLVTGLIGEVVYAMPIFIRVVFSALFPFIEFQRFLPVYFLPFITFTIGGTVLLLILKRGNNRG